MKKVVSTLILGCFFVNSIMGPNPVYAEEFRLPAPGVRVNLSPEFNPPILKGIKVHPDNPFRFDFILDQGSSPSLVKEGARGSLKQEATKLIKYFLASLTIPEKDLWVNLSPYEKNRIIPESFGLTEMGRDLLAEDYMLKQITASLIYPEDEIGKKFWKRIYQEAAKKFGTTNIPVNTFNKVWIVLEKAVVYENVKAGTAYVVEAKLKVMLEQDYLALSHNVMTSDSSRVIVGTPILAFARKHRGTKQSFSTVIPAKAGIQDTSSLGSQIVREIIIPQLTKEVNEDKNFSQLRQVYNSLILATWYKKKIKDSILAQVYEDKNKIKGLSFQDEKQLSSPNVLVGDPEHIYQRYLQAFKKGAYNYIKEEIDPMTQETIPRKYFSGGVTYLGIDKAMLIKSIFGNTWGYLKGQLNRGLLEVSSDVQVSGDESNSAISPSTGFKTHESNDDMITNRIEKNILETLSLDETKVVRSEVRIGDQKIAVTEYQVPKGELVPFHRVGLFIIIDRQYLSLLDEDSRKYRFLIIKDTSLLNKDEFPDADIRYKDGWGDYLNGVLASMVLNQKTIEGSTFIDFGAGASGIPAVAAHQLGAKELVLIEGNRRYVSQLRANLENNHIPADSSPIEIQNIQHWRDRNIENRKNIVFVMNVKNYGNNLIDGRKELSSALKTVGDRLRLAIIAGGPEDYIHEALSVLTGYLIENVQRAVFSRDDQDVPATTLIARPRVSDAAMISAKEKIQKELEGFGFIFGEKTVSWNPDNNQHREDWSPQTQWSPKSLQDSAMNGGIDFNSDKINLQVKMDSRFRGNDSREGGNDRGSEGNDNGIKFKIDPAMLKQLQNAPGFVPVIINVQPMTDLRQFLDVPSELTITNMKKVS